MSQSHLNKLIDTIDRLRGPGGCPWDQEQTPQSITGYIIEEAYELVAAIESNKDIVNEMGDVLLHIIMICSMLNDTHPTSIEDVAKSANTKMIRRHPHVFNQHKQLSIEDLHKQWDDIKASENHDESIPKQAPALIQAEHLLKKDAITVTKDAIFDALNTFEQSPTEIAPKLLYLIVGYLKKHQINSEESLRQYVQRKSQ